MHVCTHTHMNMYRHITNTHTPICKTYTETCKRIERKRNEDWRTIVEIDIKIV